jgi:hypothetical protein
VEGRTREGAMILGLCEECAVKKYIDTGVNALGGVSWVSSGYYQDIQV